MTPPSLIRPASGPLRLTSTHDAGRGGGRPDRTPGRLRTRTRAVRPLDWAFPSTPVHREVLSRLPEVDTGKPPLLFVHGLGHAAWCWDEHWMRAAAERGYPCYAVSLRGHGGSGAGERLSRTGIRDYMHDVVQTIVRLPAQPVLVGHSIGGLVVQRVLERYPARAGVLVSPVPGHSGHRLALNLTRRYPGDLVRVLAGRTRPLRREYLFGSRLDDATARGLIARMGRESPLAQYQLTLPRRARPSKAPVLVLGSPDDRLIPLADVRQVAEHYGAELRLFPGMGHDLMLDTGWQEPLDALLDWVEATVQSRPRAPGEKVMERLSG